MPLQGTLDAFSLDEVLQMLGHARKTGALDVDVPSRVGGTIYLAGGRFCGAESGELTGKVSTSEELEARLIDVCFALLRVEEGSFAFEPDRLPSWPVGAGVDVEPVLEHVRGLVRDWSAIEDVIPSFESKPSLARDLTRDTVAIDRDTWAVVSAVDGDTDVRGIARILGRSVLDVAGALKDLVGAGAVAVDGVVAPTTYVAGTVPAERRVPVPSGALEPDAVSVDLSAEEVTAPEVSVAAEPPPATTPAGAPPRRDVTPFDVSELQAAQAEAERGVAGPGPADATASAPPLGSGLSGPLAEAVAEVAALAEGTAPPPVAGLGPPSQGAQLPPPAVSTPPATNNATGAPTAAPPDGGPGGDTVDRSDPDDGPGVTGEPPDRPKPTARHRGEALRMFSSLRRT
ncbi:MAG: DUF4388 domain-containing protein [Acidimicrobiia bacterium]